MTPCAWQSRSLQFRKWLQGNPHFLLHLPYLTVAYSFHGASALLLNRPFAHKVLILALEGYLTAVPHPVAQLMAGRKSLIK
jgi:hypothetical protein